MCLGTDLSTFCLQKKNTTTTTTTTNLINRDLIAILCEQSMNFHPREKSEVKVNGPNSVTYFSQTPKRYVSYKLAHALKLY